MIEDEHEMRMESTYQKIREEEDKKPVIIAIDFDGVLHRYSKGWQDGSIYDLPVPGADRALRRLRIQGFRVVIFSTRAYPVNPFTGEETEDQVPAMVEWLNKHKIPYDEIWTKPWKPAAKIFIDDRAYHFPPSGLRAGISKVICDEWSAMENELERDGHLEPWTDSVP